MRIAQIKFIFDPHDLWVGLYWDSQIFTNTTSFYKMTYLYFVLIPTIVLKIVVKRQ